jgi:hypothetical protein
LLAVGLAVAVIALLPLPWAAAIIIGTLVAMLTLVRPQFGVLLLVPAVPFGSLRQTTVGVINVGLAEAMLGLVLAAWLMKVLDRQRLTRLIWPPLTIPVMAFIGILLLSSLGSSSLKHSIKELIKWVEVLVLYVLVANEMRGRWSRGLVFVLLGTGAAVALHGIYQFIFQVGPEGFVLFDRFMRAHGTFEQPNPYAGYLVLVLPVAVGLLVAGIARLGGRVRWSWLLWAGGCGFLMVVALIMSWSRGAWLGFAAAVAAIGLAAIARSGRVVVLGTVATLLVAYLLLVSGSIQLPTSILQRFADFLPYLGLADVRGMEVTDANFAVLERMAHWQAAISMWTEHPWLGVGIGNYATVYAKYALPQWPLALGHAHNYYLNMAGEAGALGLVAYLTLGAAVFSTVWHATRQYSGWWWGTALGVLGVAVHLAVHSLFDNLYVHAMYLNLAILLGVIAANAQAERHV